MALTPLASSVFTVAVGDWQDDDPTQEVGQFGSIAISSNLDSGCEIAFDVPGNSPTARTISELASDVWLYRTGTKLHRYRVIAIEQTWDPDGGDIVSVVAVCYKRIQNSRHVLSELTFSNTPQADIILGLIDHTQAQPGGDFGITAGSLDSGGRNRDRTYGAGENIGKLLSDLSAVIDGPWWEVNAEKQLIVQPYDSFPTRAVPIELGATARSLSRGSGASEFANAVFVDGDDAFTVPVVREAGDILTDPRGRWERAAGFPNVSLQDTLVQKSEGLVANLRTPLAQWSCEIEPSRYLMDAGFSTGDFVTIVVPPTTAAPVGNPGFSVPAQIMDLQLAVDADGAAAVSVQAIEVRPDP